MVTVINYLFGSVVAMRRNIMIGVILSAVIMPSVVFAQEQSLAVSLPACVVERLNDPALMAQGDTKVYSGKYLEAISMPVGGIGTGCIQMNGQAERAIWQIFNNYCEAWVADSFFAVGAQAKNKGAVVRVLQTSKVGPFERMDGLTFRGEYPFGWYDFTDDDLPVKVGMEVFNPLIPLNSRDSAIPCAIFNITVSNPTDTEMQVSLLATQQNAAGFMCSQQAVWPGPSGGIVFADFEGADYGSWVTTGDAFGSGPLHEILHGEQKLRGFKGKGLVNTYGADKDAATGTLKSPAFTISRDFIHFLIGGGSHEGKTCINLWVDNQKVKSTVGPNSDDMQWKFWQVGDLKGKQAYIEIVDSVTGGWGHIDIDHIVFFDESIKTFRPEIKGLGQNKNRIVKESDYSLLYMTTERKGYDADPAEAEKLCALNGVDKSKYDKGLGDMTLMVLSESAQASALWENLEKLHQSWLSGNTLTGPQEIGPSEQGKTYNGALAVPMTLGPSQSRTITFILTWNFPNAVHGAKNEKTQLNWQFQGNKYCNWWPDSMAVAGYVKDNLKRLSQESRLYHDTFYSSNLPHWLLDRISSQSAILSSKTFFWAADDYIGCWEGCCRKEGCCFGNCSHVYHYAQAHARLFPDLARKIRQQTFSYQREDGCLTNRNGSAQEAIDGMCGEILGTYREHLMSGSRAWLDSNWDHVKGAMNFIIQRWDADGDGMLSGLQHNTLDTEVSGCSSWLGSLYLSALSASQKMAELENDSDMAKKYRDISISGAKNQNDRLWNGEYYIQIPEANLAGHNYITGCSIDQVLGQWWAVQLGLTGHYPRERVQSALNALLRYNFRCNFAGVAQKPRKFVADEDAGMQMICWPNKGDRPAEPLFYADEVMTGFEYAAAATMVQYGMLKEGFMVAKAIYDRYDGKLRSDLTAMDFASWGYSGNPFGDDECGKFYGRAMSVWSLLPACQGFYYNGPEKIIGFDPVWQPENHASFFTAAQGWGLFQQKRDNESQKDIIKVAYGQLDVAEVRLTVAQGCKVSSCDVAVSGQPISVELVQDMDKMVLKFKKSVIIDAGTELEITFHL
jgi:uncharacterized protein (DUF608 family)